MLFHFALFCISGVRIDLEKFSRFQIEYSKWKGGKARWDVGNGVL